MKRTFLSFAVLFLITHISFGQDSASQSFSIKFTGYNPQLSNKARLTLDSIARIMKSRPVYNCTVLIQCVTENEKTSTAEWDRANTVINYLVKKQDIKQDRFVFRHSGEDCDCYAISISLSDKKLDSLVIPPPHPNLRRKPQMQSNK
jgi:hypothetical protein